MTASLGSSSHSTLSLSDVSGGMGSEIGPSASASQVGADSAHVSALQAQIRKAEAELVALKNPPPASYTAGYADRADSQGRCKFCLRTECLFLTGGKPCREYHQAMNYLGEQRAARRKAAEAAKDKKEDE